jgi:hypothetical protein
MSEASILILFASRSSGESTVELGASALQQHQTRRMKSNTEGTIRIIVSPVDIIGTPVPLESLIVAVGFIQYGS